jgi:hypothetical protein
MGTVFYGMLLEGSELSGLAEEALAKDLVNNQDPHRRYNMAAGPISLNAVSLQYDHVRKEWYYESSELLFQPPSYLRDALPGFVITFAELYRGYAVVDDKSGYQGEYMGAGKFAGCTAVVDSRVQKETGPRLEITVRGPVETYAGFYSAIRSRQLRPNIWWEPKLPWTIRLLQALRLIRR